MVQQSHHELLGHRIDGCSRVKQHPDRLLKDTHCGNPLVPSHVADRIDPPPRRQVRQRLDGLLRAAALGLADGRGNLRRGVGWLALSNLAEPQREAEGVRRAAFMGHKFRLGSCESTRRFPIDIFVGARMSLLYLRGALHLELPVGIEPFLLVGKPAILAVTALLSFSEIRAEPVRKLEFGHARRLATTFRVSLPFMLPFAFLRAFPFALAAALLGLERCNFKLRGRSSQRLRCLARRGQSLGIMAVTTALAEAASALVSHLVADWLLAATATATATATAGCTGRLEAALAFAFGAVHRVGGDQRST